MESLYIIFALSFVFFLICPQRCRRELRTMRDQILRLKVSVRELEHDYNRRLILSLKCAEQRAEAPSVDETAPIDQATVASPPLAVDKDEAPGVIAPVVAAVH
jgi:hypothetical protein